MRTRVLTRSATIIVWIAIGLAVPYVIGHNPYRLGQLNYILSLVMVLVYMYAPIGNEALLLRLHLNLGAQFIDTRGYSRNSLVASPLIQRLGRT